MRLGLQRQVCATFRSLAGSKPNSGKSHIQIVASNRVWDTLHSCFGELQHRFARFLARVQPAQPLSSPSPSQPHTLNAPAHAPQAPNGLYVCVSRAAVLRNLPP